MPDAEHVLGVDRGVVGGAAGGDDDVAWRGRAQRRGDRLDVLGLGRQEPGGDLGLLADLVAEGHRGRPVRHGDREAARRSRSRPRARARARRVGRAGSSTSRSPGRRPGRPARPTASASRPRRSASRSRRSPGRAPPGPAGGAPRWSRRRRHRTTRRALAAPAISASLGATGTTTSSTEANRVRSARPRPGGDRRRRVGRRQVGRFGHDREDPGAGREGDRRRLGAAGQHRSSLVSARSASSREMARWSAEPTTSRSGGGPAAASQDRRSARRALEASSSSGSNKPRAAAAPSVSSIRRWAGRSGAHRSRSIPARIAAMISTAWAAPWASACMSSASLIVNPPKPELGRAACRPSRSVTASRGGSGRRSVPAPRRGPTSPAWPRPRWPPGTARTRGRRGRRRSPARHRARGGCPGPRAPRPGKCFAEAATPADWRPRTIAAP